MATQQRNYIALLPLTALFLSVQVASFMPPQQGTARTDVATTESLLLGQQHYQPSTKLFAETESEGEGTPSDKEIREKLADVMNLENAAEEEGVEGEVLYDILTQQNPSSATPSSSYSKVGWSPDSYGATLEAATINGWSPKEDYYCWGLPGAIPPLGYFDPLGFARPGTPLNDIKRLREAEVQHGRVAMLATVGYLAGETVPASPLGITGPANDQLQQMPAPAFWFLTVAIGAAELYRAKVGWVEPRPKIGSGTLFTLRDNYYPGDIGFDPLGLKPTENYEFQRMQTKELSNGRLAMLAWAGMCAQELVNHKPILETLSFYQAVYSGAAPYSY